MLICRVVGTAVASVKRQELENYKLLIVREITVENKLRGEPFVAVDTVGAGDDEAVLVTRGSAAGAGLGVGRGAGMLKGVPIDASIVGILDSLSIEGKFTFRK